LMQERNVKKVPNGSCLPKPFSIFTPPTISK
jgi:hypothetical protein